MLDARRDRVEPRVLHELRAAEGVAGAAELRVRGGDDEDELAVRAREGLGRDAAESAVPASLRNLAGHEVVLGEVRQTGDAAVEQRDVQVLALAGAVAVAQRGEQRRTRVEPGQD